MQTINSEEPMVSFKLSTAEKRACLREIIKKNKKILYVYEQSFVPDSNYDYKVFVGAFALYLDSANVLFNGELINIKINLYSILSNDFDKKELKKIVHENTNIAQYLLKLESGEEDGGN
jgi:formiminotetrahydrofolate cyclodeaminase